MVPHARLAEIPTFVFVLNSIQEQIARHVKKSIKGCYRILIEILPLNKTLKKQPILKIFFKLSPDY